MQRNLNPRVLVSVTHILRMAYLLGNTMFLPGLKGNIIFLQNKSSEDGTYTQQVLPKNL